ncbi:hypothetical protein P3T76_012960 [Phytophthora citrophthora]|uniref:RxLR effector protein n=1 Tax=Phytophthora citrophthora TaxID=4793 RepID=A0AAD9G4I3_9STRA|nr:hypothetical protein P3T76_012960 [Phytophthora citrophthora]
MRLTSILLVLAAALIGVLDATSAAIDNTVANRGMVKSDISPAIHSHRSLRHVKDEDESADEGDEERMWFSKAKQALEDKLALTAVASNFVGKSADEMGEMLQKLKPEQINTIFDKGEASLQQTLPGLKTGMSFQQFDDLISRLPSSQQGSLISACLLEVSRQQELNPLLG